MMNSSLFRQQALQLLSYDQTSQSYKLNQSVLQMVQNIPSPLGVISVAGLYRTGQSYLLNRMLLDRSSGFGIGSTINACTKGLWIWGSPLQGTTVDGESINILVIDSEGIGALDEDQGHDSRIFSLAVLLSSCFIYNSVGSIDENAIQNLSLIVNLTKHIQSKCTNNSSNNGELSARGAVSSSVTSVEGTSDENDQEKEDLSGYFPCFNWVIRDFSLQLVDGQGEPISSKEYLERALKPQKGFSDEVEQKNRIRRLLTTFFKERDCVTFVRPLTNQANLQKLEKMDLEQLRPEFFQQVIKLRKKILTRMKPKSLNGKLLNGMMYVNMIRQYIKSINAGSVPNIESTWNYICKDECTRAISESFEFYEKSIQELRIPMSLEELKTLNKQIKYNCLELFRKKCVGDNIEEFEQELIKRIKTKFALTKQVNEKQSVSTCQNYINREFLTIEKKLRSNEYKSFFQFEQDLKLFYAFLIEHGPKTAQRDIVFLDFLHKMTSEASVFFLKTAQNDLELQKLRESEITRKTEKEIKQLKESLLKQKSAFMRELNESEKEKANLKLQIETLTVNFSEIEENNQNLEREVKNQQSLAQQQAQNQISLLQKQLADQQDTAKKLQRDLYVKQTSYQKEVALLEHKAQHYEKLNQELSKKEREYDSQFSHHKSSLSEKLKETAAKYEAQVKSLESKLSDAFEKSQELADLLNSEREAHQKQLLNFETSEISLKQALEEANNSIMQLKTDVAQLMEQNEGDTVFSKSEYSMPLSARSGYAHSDIRSQKELIFALEELRERCSNQEEQLRQSAENYKILELQHQKKEAIADQKMEFLEADAREAQLQLIEAKKAHQSTLNALQLQKSPSDSSLNMTEREQKSILELKQLHSREIKQLQAEFQTQRKNLENQAEILSRDLRETELKLKMATADHRHQVQELKQKITLFESAHEKILLTRRGTQAQRKNNESEIESRYSARVSELEEQLEKVKRQSERELQEVQDRSEEQLIQLKNFYNLERERLEKRILEEKEKRDQNYNSLIEEYEQKLRDQESQYQEEIQSLKDEVLELDNNLQANSAHFRHEIELQEANISNLDRLLQQSRQNLNQTQESFNVQLEQQLMSMTNQRVCLSQKIDQLTIDISQREKEILLLNQQKQQIQNGFNRQESNWDQLRQTLLSEQNEAEKNYDDLKSKYQSLNDEFLENKIVSQKTLALSSQQNEFNKQRIEELQNKMHSYSIRYEDRIKSQQDELGLELTQRIGKLKEEKQVLEEKYEKLKKSSKEIELNQNQIIGELQKSKAVYQERISHLEAKINELESTINTLNDSSQIKIQSMRDQLITERKYLQRENDELRTNMLTLESEKHEISTLYERDKVLWQGKFAFLEQQKEQAKQDLQENMRKFEQTLHHVQQARVSQKSEQENNISETLLLVQKKHQIHLAELNESHTSRLLEAQEKTRKLEKQLKSIQDKMALDAHNQSSHENFLDKKLSEAQEKERKLTQQIQELRQELDQKVGDISKRSDKEKEAMRMKIIDLENKIQDMDQKQNSILFENEKEKAKWNLEKDHLINSKNQLQDILTKLEKKRDVLLRENQKLQSDLKTFKKESTNSYSNLNISRNVSQSPLSSHRSMAHNRDQSMSTYLYGGDTSMIDTSHIEPEKENQTSSMIYEEEQSTSIYSGRRKNNSMLLGGILENSRENINSINQPVNGFQSYFQIMQGKTQSIDGSCENSSYVSPLKSYSNNPNTHSSPLSSRYYQFNN